MSGKNDIEGNETNYMEKKFSVKEWIKSLKWDNFLYWCILVFALCLLIDLGTKALAEALIEEGERISFIPGFMNLTLTYNSGMAFSMFSDNPIAMGIITWMTVPVMLFFCGVIYFLPKHYNVCRILLSAVTAGALGNFIDRVMIPAGVRDFMDVSSIGFGVCNFADYFISIGGVILIACYIYCVFTEKEEPEEGKEAVETELPSETSAEILTDESMEDLSENSSEEK